MWIDPITGYVARLHSDIRTLRPNWSGPSEITDDMISELKFEPVTVVQPIYDTITQVATELSPELVDGIWIQKWEITDLSESQIRSNLGSAVAAKNAEINEARLKANSTSFSYMGKQIAVDTVSFNDIISTNGYVALFGEFAPNWPGGWKTVDNSYVPIATVDDWKKFYRAMYDKGNTNFSRAQALKSQLAKATTAEEINSINWNSVIE